MLFTKRDVVDIINDVDPSLPEWVVDILQHRLNNRYADEEFEEWPYVHFLEYVETLCINILEEAEMKRMKFGFERSRRKLRIGGKDG